MRLLSCVLVLTTATLPLRAADVAELSKNLVAKDTEVRRAAAKELGELGSNAKAATGSLTKALTDSDRFVRRFAAQALGAIGPDAKDAIPALTKAFGDDQPQVREAAVKALGKMGSLGVPALTKALGGTADVQGFAITALGEAGAEGGPGLVSAMKDSRTPVNLRRKAIEVLLGQKKPDTSAVPALTQVAQKPQAKGPDVRQLRLDAIDALGRLASNSDKSTIAMLEGIANDEKLMDNQLKTAAKRALSSIKKRK